jgi:hypothetical protein
LIRESERSDLLWIAELSYFKQSPITPGQLGCAAIWLPERGALHKPDYPPLFADCNLSGSADIGKTDMACSQKLGRIRL